MKLLTTFAITLVIFGSFTNHTAALPTVEIIQPRGGCLGKTCKVVDQVVCCLGHNHGAIVADPQQDARDRRKKYGDPRFVKTPSPTYHDSKSQFSPSPVYGKGPRPVKSAPEPLRKERYKGFQADTASKPKHQPSSTSKGYPGGSGKPQSVAHGKKPRTSSHGSGPPARTSRTQSKAEGKRPVKASPDLRPSTSYHSHHPNRRNVPLSRRGNGVIQFLRARMFSKGCISAGCKDVVTTGGVLHRKKKYATPNYTGKYLAKKKQDKKDDAALATASSSPLGSPGFSHNPTMATYDKPPKHHLDLDKYHANVDHSAAAAMRERIEKARQDRHAQVYRVHRPEPKKPFGTKVKNALKEIAKPAHHHHRRRALLKMRKRGQCVSAFCSDITHNKILRHSGKIVQASNKWAEFKASEKKKKKQQQQQRESAATGPRGSSHDAGTSRPGHSRTSSNGSSSDSFHSIESNSSHGSPRRHSISDAAGSPAHHAIHLSPPTHQKMGPSKHGHGKSVGR